MIEIPGTGNEKTSDEHGCGDGIAGGPGLGNMFKLFMSKFMGDNETKGVPIPRDNTFTDLQVTGTINSRNGFVGSEKHYWNGDVHAINDGLRLGLIPGIYGGIGNVGFSCFRAPGKKKQRDDEKFSHSSIIGELAARCQGGING